MTGLTGVSVYMCVYDGSGLCLYVLGVPFQCVLSSHSVDMVCAVCSLCV